MLVKRTIATGVLLPAVFTLIVSAFSSARESINHRLFSPKDSGMKTTELKALYFEG